VIVLIDDVGFGIAQTYSGETFDVGADPGSPVLADLRG
jgi:hypothetical protein